MLNERTYPTPDSCLTHLFPRSQAVVANTVLVWSRLNAPVELSTRYTTLDTTVEIGSECDRGIIIGKKWQALRNSSPLQHN